MYEHSKLLLMRVSPMFFLLLEESLPCSSFHGRASTPGLDRQCNVHILHTSVACTCRGGPLLMMDGCGVAALLHKEQKRRPQPPRESCCTSNDWHLLVRRCGDSSNVPSGNLRKSRFVARRVSFFFLQGLCTELYGTPTALRWYNISHQGTGQNQK